MKNKKTLKESAEIWVHNRFTKQIKDEDIYASEISIVQSHILFAKWQQERSYSEEDMKESYAMGRLNKSIKDFNKKFNLTI